MGVCISEGNISQGRVLISVLWWDWLTTTPAVLLSIYDKKHLLVTGCSEKKHELPARLSLEKVSHTIIIKVSFLHRAQENTACLNLDLNPRRGWGVRSCRWPSLFLAFLRYLFKQKSSFFFLQSEGRKEATAHLPSMCKTAGGVFEHPEVWQRLQWSSNSMSVLSPFFFCHLQRGER